MENGTEGSGFSMKNISNKIKLLKMFYKENLKLYQNQPYHFGDGDSLSVNKSISQ